MNYISVESVEEYSKKVVALGGKIVVPKMEITGIGWWALALDPEGNQFGILELMQK
jgi:predicted enzyme related to lactoylglutathione lyase